MTPGRAVSFLPATIRIVASFAVLLALVTSPLVADGGERSESERDKLTKATAVRLDLEPSAPGRVFPRIVNGVPVQTSPATVALYATAHDVSFCSGTLVGCSTVVTAAHCVCEGSGEDCQPGGTGLLDSSLVEVFSQSAGFFEVDRIDVPEDFEFGVTGDIAVLHLADPVRGVHTIPINEVGTPAFGSQGLIEGWGNTEAGNPDSGLLRAGLVTVDECVEAAENSHICWSFADPVGPAGEDSNTCEGDSGGPLFVDYGSGLILAGATSGGLEPSACLQGDRAFDSDVFFERDWIRSVAGADLDRRVCGDFAPALDSESPVLVGEGELQDFQTHPWEFTVPEETETLVITVNGIEDENDFDLFADFDELPEATAGGNDPCQSFRDGTFESCIVEDPEPGTWFAVVAAFGAKGGEYQITFTLLGTPSSCEADEETLCAGEGGRFRVRVTWKDFQGKTGTGKAVDIDRRDSGLFWFFGPQNLELLVKVLDGCSVNDHFWVFAAATTTVEYEITVLDTETGEIVTYENPLGVAPPATTDTGAFPCS